MKFFAVATLDIVYTNQFDPNLYQVSTKQHHIQNSSKFFLENKVIRDNNECVLKTLAQVCKNRYQQGQHMLNLYKIAMEANEEDDDDDEDEEDDQ